MLRLEREVKKESIKGTCSAREKDLDSLVKKAMSGKYNDPYTQIHDKAGVRLLLVYADDLSTVKSVIEDLFDIKDSIDKTSELHMRSDALGYHGYHYEVELGKSCLRDIEGKEYDLGSYLCEIQIQTRAQNVWNDVSHMHLYKPFYNVPEPMKHDFFRLVALMEIFDDELVRLRGILDALPESKVGSILHELERKYYSLTVVPYNTELSMDMIEMLSGLLSEDESTHFDSVVSNFVDRKGYRLESISEDSTKKILRCCCTNQSRY